MDGQKTDEQVADSVWLILFTFFFFILKCQSVILCRKTINLESKNRKKSIHIVVHFFVQ